MKYYPLLFCSVLIISSCASPPKSRLTLVDSGVNAGVLCINEKREVIELNIEKHMNKCYSSSGFRLNGVLYDSPFTYIKSSSESEIEFSVVTKEKGPSGYLLTISVTTGEASCSTKLSSYVFNSMWLRHVKSIEDAAKGNTPSCNL